jgi:HPt (histidine-containing phosphotransfer) domain-containing protein
MNLQSEAAKQIINYLREAFEIEAEDAAGLIESYIETIDGYMEQTETLLVSGGWHELNRIGHTIKGTSANIGAEPIRAEGYGLECAGKEENADACKKHIENIKNLINKLK